MILEAGSLEAMNYQNMKEFMSVWFRSFGANSLEVKDLGQYFDTVNTDQYFCVSSKCFACITSLSLINGDWLHSSCCVDNFHKS